MALPDKPVEVVFSRGLDTKTDPKLVAKLTTLDNGYFSAPGSISKRPGTTAVATSKLGGGNIALSSTAQLHTRRGQLLVGDGVEAWAFSGSAWTDLGKLTPVALSLEHLASGVVRYLDVAYDGARYSCWAWKDADAGAIRTLVIDESTGAPVAGQVSISSTSGATDVCVVSPSAGQFIVFWLNGTALGGAKVAAATGVVSGAVSTIATVDGISGHLSACVGSSGVVIGYQAGGSNPTVALLDSSLGISTTRAATGLGGSFPRTALAYANGAIWFAWGYQGGTLNVVQTAANLSSAAGALAVESCTPFCISIAQHGSNARVFFSSTDAGTAAVHDSIRYVDCTVSAGNVAAAAGPGTFANRVQPASAAFTDPGGSACICGAVRLDDGAADTALFIFDASGSVIAHGLRGRRGTGAAGPAGDSWPALVNMARLPGAFIRSGVLHVAQLESLSQAQGVSAVARVKLESTPSARIEHEDTAFWAGAAPLMFDGQTLQEVGFWLSPEASDVTLTAGSSGAAVAGTYLVAVCYERRDANGRLWRSTPSVAKSVTLTAGQKVTIAAPYLRLTRNPTLHVAIFASLPDETTLYRLGSLPNLTSAATGNYVWSDPGAHPDGSEEALYTTGGTLEIEPMPACRSLCVHQSRLFATGLERTHEAWFTQALLAGEGFEWNESLALLASSECGGLTACAVMDERLVLFAERGGFVVPGEGPDRLGESATYSAPQRLPIPFGVALGQERSVCAFTEGVLFASAQGPRVLSRTLELAAADGLFAGAEMDALFDTAFKGVAAPHPTRPQIVLTQSHAAIVFDYMTGQWSRFTGWGDLDVVRYGSTLAFVLRDGSAVPHAFVEDGTVFTDAGTAYSLGIETGWLKVAGINGFERCRRVQVLGARAAAAAEPVVLSVGFDYEAAYPETTSVDLNAITAGANLVTRFERHVAKQKCEAMRFKLVESGSASVSFTGLTLLVGAKSGRLKLPSSQRA